MTDTPQGAWIREYERLMLAYKGAVITYYDSAAASVSAGEGMRAARTALDAHVRGLVEENERLRGALFRCVDGWAKGDDIAGPMRAARVALAAPKDAP